MTNPLTFKFAASSLLRRSSISETHVGNVNLQTFNFSFMAEKIWYLKEINILKSLSESQRMKLGSFCFMTNFRQGDLIYLPGDVKNIYFLKFGSIKLITQEADGGEIIRDVLEKGEIFGKCFGGENAEPPQEAIAVEDSMVCYLSYEKWQEFLKENLDLSLSIFKWAALRIKSLQVSEC
jgi:CRP/FNR family cyclic AMP-dependent transcriptional regulator